MSESPKRITEQELERYLDEQLSAEENAEFERRLTFDPDAALAVRVQRELDAKLRGAFSPPDATVSQIEAWLDAKTIGTGSNVDSQNRSRRRKLLLVVTAIAASIGWAVALWNWSDNSTIEPYFEPRALTEIYRETVDQGFRPYYFCEDEARFEMTFAARQKVPLRLAKLPDDRRMVGLSYAGGLSRDTTAILCYFREQPVMVFVDRQQRDNISVTKVSSAHGLHVHRTQLGELVIYEVSPLEQAKLSTFLEVSTDFVRQHRRAKPATR